MNRFTFVYSYFNNPNMLRKHIETWNNYPNEIQKNLEIIVTDDCSSRYQAEKVLQEYDCKSWVFSFSLFYIQRKADWNWLACRNIGAYHASHKWILLTDMDLLVPVDTIEYLVYSKLDPEEVYLLKRRDMPEMKEVKPHDDSYVMAKNMFWRIGGYDERLSGFYGTAGSFRKRIQMRIYPHRILNRKDLDGDINLVFIRLPVYLIRYFKEQIADCDTPITQNKIRGETRLDDHFVTLSFPYEKKI